MITLSTADVAQICQRSRGTPSVSCFSKYRKGTLIQFPCCRQISLFARNIAKLVNRPSGAAAITEFFENILRFAQRPSRAWIVAANLKHIGKVMQATRDCQTIREQTPARETPLKIVLRGGVVAAISRHNCQSIQRCGDAGLIAQFLIKQQTLLEMILGSRIVALSCSQGANKVRQPGPFSGVSRTGELEDSLKPTTALGQMFTHVPESKQGHAETQTPLQIVGLE